MPHDPSGSSCGSTVTCPYTAFLCGKGTFIISAAVLVLFILNCGMIAANRMMQNDIVEEQQLLAQKNNKAVQNQTFANIYQGIVQALAHAAIDKHDDQIKKILDDNGLRIQPAAAKKEAAPPAKPAAPAPTTP